MAKDFSEWDEVAKQVESVGYFKIEEGVNKFVLLSHIAPLAQVYDPATKKYRIAQEGDTNVSVKGVCWVLQKVGDTYEIKEAKLPYTIVKSIKGIAEDPDWSFELPFLHPLTLSAVGAGTKEVKYSLTPSPKKFELPEGIAEELAKKPTPEDIVEKIKNGSSEDSAPKAPDYPDEDINPDDTPF